MRDFLIPALILLTTRLSFVASRPNGDGEHLKSTESCMRCTTSTERSLGSACPNSDPVELLSPKNNVWQGLTAEETASVVQWLFQQKELNLTVSGHAGEWDNSLLLVELQQPNKTDALAYIDGSEAPPARYAHCVLDVRATPEAVYSEILVGPLPVSTGTSWLPLEYSHTRRDEGKVQNLGATHRSLRAWLIEHTMSIADITMDLFSGYWNGSDENPLRLSALDTSDPEDLLPTGLFLNANVSGRDPSKWVFKGWLYNSIFYPDTRAFRDAYSSPHFVKLGANMEGDWTKTDQQGPILPMDRAAPPITYAPGGPRFAIDRNASYVKWMGWSFFLSFGSDRGISLLDVRYEDERILYELGLQEGLGHYAGNDPIPGSLAFLDSAYGFGASTSRLVRGYDCPDHATYLNTSSYREETMHAHIDSVCLFETVAPYPIQRHSTGRYVSGTKNVYFTVRSIATMDNYDYILSYEFYLDGSLKVQVHASGYIMSAYYANNQEYGYRIHEHLSGAMHDHVLNFKADFDVLGRQNTMEVTTVTPATESYVWSSKPRNTMKLKRRFIQSEDESKLLYDQNMATSYSIVNADKPNRYGEYRGYRIMPMGSGHLTVEGSSILHNAVNWAKYDLAATVQKDSEPHSTHPLNGQDVHDPPVDFDKFFDGESLKQEDIVVWLNLGMHHVPHTGDLPNTVTTTAHIAVHFVPLNYFEMDMSRQTVNQVRIEYNRSHVVRVQDFGQEDTTCQVDLANKQPRTYEYSTDLVTKLLPFASNTSFYEES